MNAFYYNPEEDTQGFKGWYQRMCHKLNRKGFQYIVGEDVKGNETITIFQPEILIDQKDIDGVATVHHPDKVQEVKRLENPDNF